MQVFKSKLQVKPAKKQVLFYIMPFRNWNTVHTLNPSLISQMQTKAVYKKKKDFCVKKIKIKEMASK